MVAFRVDKNVNAWRNIYHYGNSNAERAPAMWLFPNNHGRFISDLEVIKIGMKDMILKYKQFRNIEGLITIKTTINKEDRMNRFRISHTVNDIQVGERIITGALAALYIVKIYG